MISFIQAELRKSWKTKKLLIAILCFLCFMGCAYYLSQRRDTNAHIMETYALQFENEIAGSEYETLKSELQNTPEKDEPPTLRARYKLWEEAQKACYDYSMVRQASEYYGWEDIAKAALRRSKAIENIWTSKYYDGEFDGGNRTLKDTQNDIVYYTYLKEHQLTMYTSVYEPNFLNFIMQLFQNETMVLLIIISAFFLIDQLCQDFDYGTYKSIYITPKKRTKIMAAKIISSLCMNAVAFVIALLLISFLPIMQHGIGYINYPYMLNHQMIMFIPLFLKTMGLMLLVLLFYMVICVIAANKFKNTTNTLLVVAGILLFVYFCFKFFSTHMAFINWLPIFYFYPYEIISGAYDHPFYICMTICVVSLFAMYLLFHKRIETIDFIGGESS